METKDNGVSGSDSVMKLAKRLKRKYPLLYNEVGTKGIKQILKKVITNKKNDKIKD
jgi:hypothetical protein